ncbi:MAG: hypothetical protein WDM86_14405 [Rhizomicrobium sp.]
MLAGARGFILRNARLLERRRFAAEFEGGPASAVVTALAAYRNDDGGFGVGLEPDKRDPASQPVDVQCALETMDSAGAFDRQLALGACDFLAKVSTAEGGVPFALPSVNSFPHVPWWDCEADPPANLNPTAALLGVLLKHRVEHDWIAPAVAFCWEAIAKIHRTEFHELMPVLAFLEHAPDRARAEVATRDVLGRIAAPGAVEHDPDASGYVHMPLEWAPSPDSPCRRLFSDALIGTHLKALAAKQKDDGGWPISWDPISPGVEIEWRGVRTLDALRTLKAYGFHL